MKLLHISPNKIKKSLTLWTMSHTPPKKKNSVKKARKRRYFAPERNWNPSSSSVEMRSLESTSTSQSAQSLHWRTGNYFPMWAAGLFNSWWSYIYKWFFVLTPIDGRKYMRNWGYSLYILDLFVLVIWFYLFPDIVDGLEITGHPSAVFLPPALGCSTSWNEANFLQTCVGFQGFFAKIDFWFWLWLVN